jgi:hypothetical protein
MFVLTFDIGKIVAVAEREGTSAGHRQAIEISYNSMPYAANVGQNVGQNMLLISHL